MSSPTVLAYLFPPRRLPPARMTGGLTRPASTSTPRSFSPMLGTAGARGNRCAPDAPPPHGAVSGRSPTTKRTASGVGICPVNGSLCATPFGPGPKRPEWPARPSAVSRCRCRSLTCDPTPRWRHEYPPAR
jgi:hypothetical protein